MTFRDRLSDFLFYGIIGTLYAFALSDAVMAATVLHYPLTRLFLLCGLFMLLFYMIFYNKYSFLAVAAASALALLILYVFLRRREFQVGWYLELRAYLEELSLFIRGLVPYQERYSGTIATGIAFLIALMTALNLRVHFNFYVLTLVGVLVMVIPRYMDYGDSERSVALFILCFLMFLAKRLNLFVTARAGGRRANPRTALGVIPICTAVLLLSYILPKPQAAPGGESVQQNIINAADNLIYDIGPNQTMSFTDRSNRLGGPIEMGNEFVMEVLSEEPIYLSGSIKDTYTGSTWETSRDERAQLPAPGEDGWRAAADYPEEMLAQQAYYMRFYGRTKKMVTVNTGEDRTRNLFSPPFRERLWVSDETPIHQNTYGKLAAGRPLGKRAVYAQEYISWDYGNSYFTGMLQELAHGGDDVELEPYLQLPPELPQRVHDLAGELTAGASNGYDKLKALERYLAAFPYTLHPDEVPAGEDFVDHFLFEGQEGYCVYYASALAVMARSVGIPARYVEGFGMPRDRNEQGGFTVTTAQAHAWTEAYFPGFGWVIFEATPPNYTQFYNRQLPEPEVVPEQTEPVDPELPAEDAASEPKPPPAAEDTRQSPALPASPEQHRSVWPVALAVCVMLAAGVAVLLRMAGERNRKRMEKIESMPNREASVAYFSCILQAAGVCGYPIFANETAHAYAKRVGDELPLSKKGTGLEELADVFSRACYSNAQIEDGERGKMKGCYEELLARLRKSRSAKLRLLLGRHLWTKC